MRALDWLPDSDPPIRTQALRDLTVDARIGELGFHMAEREGRPSR